MEEDLSKLFLPNSRVILPDDDVMGIVCAGGDDMMSKKLNLLLLSTSEQKREEVKSGIPQSQQIHERLRPSYQLNAAMKPPPYFTQYQPLCRERLHSSAHTGWPAGPI